MKKAFTLIELLIVIALLGALAVGLLAALDPFEQLKKGTDTGTRNTVSELHGAVIRYYAIRTEMPWSTVNPVVLSIPITQVSLGYSAIGISNIITAGELKADFSVLAGNQLKEMSLAGTSDNVTVCFKPSSKAFRSDQNTKYNASFSDLGTNSVANCGLAGAQTFSCYWCVR